MMTIIFSIDSLCLNYT